MIYCRIQDIELGSFRTFRASRYYNADGGDVTTILPGDIINIIHMLPDENNTPQLIVVDGLTEDGYIVPVYHSPDIAGSLLINTVRASGLPVNGITECHIYHDNSFAVEIPSNEHETWWQHPHPIDGEVVPIDQPAPPPIRIPLNRILQFTVNGGSYQYRFAIYDGKLLASKQTAV